MKSEKVNVYAIDALRVLSIIAVIFIHTTTRVLEHTMFDLNDYGVTLFLNQVFRFAVPLFFMISGFVLELHYHLNESFLDYLKKRFNRIFTPYVFWSALYYFLIYQTHSSNFFYSLLTGGASYQLYFIPSLLIFYVTFPLLHKLYKYLATPLALTFLGSLEICILYQDYYVHHMTYPYPVNIVFFNFFIFLTGMIASHNQEKIKATLGKIKFFLIPLTVFLAGYIYVEGRDLYLKTYDIGKFYSQWRPDVLLYTVVVASLCYYFFTKTDFSNSLIKTFSRLSFFVYFIHVAVLEILWKYTGIYTFRFPGFDLWFFTTVAGASFLIAYAAHKIPQIARITG